MLVLIANGIDDHEIDGRLVLLPGTTALLADEVVRGPGISRALLQSSADQFQADLLGRFSRAIVPIAMRDRRTERPKVAGASGS